MVDDSRLVPVPCECHTRVYCPPPNATPQRADGTSGPADRDRTCTACTTNADRSSNLILALKILERHKFECRDWFRFWMMTSENQVELKYFNMTVNRVYCSGKRLSHLEHFLWRLVQVLGHNAIELESKCYHREFVSSRRLFHRERDPRIYYANKQHYQFHTVSIELNRRNEPEATHTLLFQVHSVDRSVNYNWLVRFESSGACKCVYIEWSLRNKISYLCNIQIR